MGAVILILKHATFLRMSNEQEEALTWAEQDYQKANIDLKIQDHLKAVPPEDFVEQFAGFIRATEIGLFIHLSIPTIISLSVQYHLSLQRKQGDKSSKQFWEAIFV